MNSETRKQIIDLADACGFTVRLKEDKTDLYDKNLIFRSKAYASDVYVNKVNGISDISGTFRYLKVAVHPFHFRPELVSAHTGIEEDLNRRTGVNLHSSSNYSDFPHYKSNKEPCGKCYKVGSLAALQSLLQGFQRAT
jgi:hypothetical protein